MKTAKYSLMFLACAAAFPAVAQNTTGPWCGMTNFDGNRNAFTVANGASGTTNQQCFINVVSKESWSGGAPDVANSQFVEGNYQVALSGGGGGGGGGAGGGNEPSANGEGGFGAVPLNAVRYLKPGVYRLTIGSGGSGGAANGGHGADGAPTSLSNANSGETVAGFPRAEFWGGSYPQQYSQASRQKYVQVSDRDARGDDGRQGTHYSGAPSSSGGGTGGNDAGHGGFQGSNGFIRLALADAAKPARAQPAPAAVSETVTTPPPAAIRPARKDRN